MVVESVPVDTVGAGSPAPPGGFLQGVRCFIMYQCNAPTLFDGTEGEAAALSAAKARVAVVTAKYPLPYVL